MLYLFDYGGYGNDYDHGSQNDRIVSFFGSGNDPAKAAFLPAAALIFRVSLPDHFNNDNTFTLPVSASEQNGGKAADVWKAALASSSDVLGRGKMIDYRIAIRPVWPPKESVHPRVEKKASMYSGITSVSPGVNRLFQTSSGAQYRATSPNDASVVGFVGGQTVTLGGDTLTFPKFGNNFAAVTLTPTDGKPLAESRRLLLTLAGKVENHDMGWNATRTSVGDQWGHGPTVAEGIPAAVTLKTKAARRVWALGGTGKRVQQVPATYAAGALTFTVGPQYKTLWYEVGE